MSYSQIAQFDNIRYAAGSGLTTTYSKLGAVTTHPMRLSCVSNNYSTDMLFAITNGSTPLSDGSEDQFFVAAGGFKLIDITANKVNQAPSVFCIAAGQQVWVRLSPNAVGVYLEFIFGNGET